MQSPTTPVAAIGTPFRNVEEAWFWFAAAMEARADGATPGRGRGDIPRPCEPMDIYQILHRLHRGRRLRMEHFRVLAHYGKRRTPPEPLRHAQKYSAKLWQEAMKELDYIFQRRGIIRTPFSTVETL